MASSRAVEKTVELMWNKCGHDVPHQLLCRCLTGAEGLASCVATESDEDIGMDGHIRVMEGGKKQSKQA
jgi:hypothetical protein